jgi:hypothetical protein
MVHDEMAAVLIKSIARNGNTPERTSEASHLIPDLRKAENFFDDAWDTEDALAVRINLLTLMRCICFTDEASQHDDEAKAEALLDGHPELDLTLRIPFYHNLCRRADESRRLEMRLGPSAATKTPSQGTNELGTSSLHGFSSRCRCSCERTIDDRRGDQKVYLKTAVTARR